MLDWIGFDSSDPLHSTPPSQPQQQLPLLKHWRLPSISLYEHPSISHAGQPPAHPIQFQPQRQTKKKEQMVTSIHPCMPGNQSILFRERPPTYCTNNNIRERRGQTTTKGYRYPSIHQIVRSHLPRHALGSGPPKKKENWECCAHMLMLYAWEENEQSMLSLPAFLQDTLFCLSKWNEKECCRLVGVDFVFCFATMFSTVYP